MLERHNDFCGIQFVQNLNLSNPIVFGSSHLIFRPPLTTSQAYNTWLYTDISLSNTCPVCSYCCINFLNGKDFPSGIYHTLQACLLSEMLTFQIGYDSPPRTSPKVRSNGASTDRKGDPYERRHSGPKRFHPKVCIKVEAPPPSKA